jgi:HK97 family phage portal protein
MNEENKILGSDGKPFPTSVSTPQRQAKSLSFMQALAGLDNSYLQRASKPFENHAWVFTAAMIRATNLAQAPFLIYRETERQISLRQEKSIRLDGHWHGPKTGSRRRAVQRHLTRSANPLRFFGVRHKKLEEDLNHPLSELLLRVNPVMTTVHLWQITSLWMSLRGECFWLLGNDPIDKPLGLGQVPSEIWPLSPDLFMPIITNGILTGWKYRPPKGFPRSQAGVGREIILESHEVVQFKYANPEDPFRGITPISAAASGIALDMSAKNYNAALIKNGADPGGLLLYDGEMDEDEEKEALRRFKQRHQGARKQGQTAILSGPWKYMPTGLSPKDMAYLEMLQWDRDEIFAVLRVPKSVAGITDNLNYATQLGQDKNLWDKSILPDISLFEATLDATLFFNLPDNIVGAFDLSGIESLKQGLSEQINMADNLCGTNLHMDPKTAFNLVGLDEIEPYPGDDVALINGLGTMPLTDVLAGDNEPVQDPNEEKPEPDSDGTKAYEGLTTRQSSVEPRGQHLEAVRKANNKAQYKAFLFYQRRSEKRFKAPWRSWVKKEKEIALAKFDAKVKALSVDNILLQLQALEAMSKRLEKATKKAYEQTAVDGLFSVEYATGKLPIIELDDPAIQKALKARREVILQSAPETIRAELDASLKAGLEAGETIPQLRSRVAKVYNVSQGSAKTLTVARTEGSNYLNTAREALLKKQGFTEFEWLTAGDAEVRESHVFCAQVGPVKEDTNYAELPGFNGTSALLRYPGDPAASAGDSVNCRCTRVPLLTKGDK